MEHSEIVQTRESVAATLKNTKHKKDVLGTKLLPHQAKRLDEYILILSRAEKHLEILDRAGGCRNMPALHRMFNDMSAAACRLVSAFTN